MLTRLLACTIAFAAPLAALAQTPPQVSPAVEASAPLEARIGELAQILAGKGDYDAYFAPAFRSQIPKEKFAQINAQIAATAGPMIRIESITPRTPWVADVTIGFREAIGTVRISVAATEPHQVDGLLFSGLTPRVADMGSVRAAIAALPGRTGFALARLGDSAPQMLLADHGDTPFAIGSAFKLVILAELVRAVNAGERRWDDMVTLDGGPLPGGQYMNVPAGTKVTLRELAQKMISISDNSATDILLKHLGRERVEAMLAVVGIADPKDMTPFPGTLEIFKLKGVPGLADRYLALDPAGRRQFLDGEVARTPIAAISPTLFRDGKPVRIEQLEWVATPTDLIRVMDWLRRNSATGPGAEARAILGLNPGIPQPAAAKWKWAGYKGGSEPGVMHMTLLLEGKDGSWYALSSSWNNPAAPVEDVRFAGLVGRAAELAAPQP
ncbi:MAG: serine hydrolase [Sphingomonas sp.]